MGLILTITLSHKIRFGIGTGKLLQGLSQDVGSQPLSLSQRFTERSVLGDNVVNRDTHVSSCSLQSVLKLLATHTCVHDRVPVHKAYSACRQSLGKLIHRCRGLSRGRTRHSRQVRDTLNRGNRGLQVDTGSGERTDVASHLGKIVNSLIRVRIQLVKSIGNLFDRGSLAGRVGHDGLNRVKLELILSEAIGNRIYGELAHHVATGADDRVRDVRKSGDSCDLQRIEFNLYRIDRLLETG